jgi:threonylcarbamoyladenosine tRNA methylthiotransferase MtaB
MGVLNKKKIVLIIFLKHSDHIRRSHENRFLHFGLQSQPIGNRSLNPAVYGQGYEIAPFSHICDLYIINTCTVTAVSDHKCRQAIRRAKRNNPAALVAVTGCYSQLNPGQFAKMAEVDIVTGTNNRMNLINLVEEALLKKEKTGAASPSP